ncbi:MAG: hypothetical protein N2483_11170 [Burkholderiaceae bacterium]|nr:hypothetical protein [Burkholderiaceae bacterium]
MGNTGKLSLLLALLFILTGCASFTAKPSTIDFQGASWRVSSAETVDEFASIRPTSTSDVLLVVTFDIEGETIPKSQAMDIARAFSDISLRDSNVFASSILIGFTEDEKSINQVQCAFVVGKGTKSVELLLPDSQIIEITVNR